MTIATGTRFGPYEVLTSLGAGGMGEVYRARDTRLGRDVALKILPAAFASDPDRLARFEREARTLASLNHPHIAQIYGFEDRALAMELVEGEDLAERLARGPVPLDEALPIARQIADALQAAHDQGIIHRDLKPANIKVRPDGFVKVLDFGLAKALSPDSGVSPLPSSLTTAATLTSPAVTGAGIILGTASYMSPEQARGKAVDTRADVWAFGVVLYEMLTGALPFAGETTTDVLAAVVRADVDFAHLPAATPLSVRRLLRRCLAKDPSRRLRDMADTRLEIDDAIADPAEHAAATVVAPASRRARRWFIVALLAVLAALIPFAVLGVRHVRERVAVLPEFRFDVPSSLPTILNADASSFVLSPDARHLAYIDGDRRLWIRSMDSPTPRLLPGLTEVRYLAWSPDGRAIAFAQMNAGMQLKRVNADGSGLTTLTAAPSFFGMTWGEGDVLLIATSEGLVRLPASGGDPTVVVPATPDRLYAAPRFVSAGRFVFLSADKSLGPRRKVLAASLDNARPTELFETQASRVEYVGSGFLLVVEQDALYARPFDPARMVVTGEPVPVLRGVAPFSAVDGAIAYRPPITGGLLQLAWLDRSGRVLENVAEPVQMGAEVELAPDGRHAATVRMANGNFDIWLVETARGVASRVTTTPTLTRWPTWSPDGRQLVYAEAKDLHTIDVDGAGAPQVLFADPQQKMPSDIAPDGKHLIYRAQTEADPRGDLWILPLEGERKPVPFSVTEARETRAQFSPDGRWVSYDSDESGRMEVYVRPFQRPGARVRLSIDGGVEGRWQADGREMFFVDPQGELMSVAVQPSADGRVLDVERPRALFKTRLLGGGSYPANFKFHYDVSRDGQRFLMLQASDEAAAATIAVIANWSPRRP